MHALLDALRGPHRDAEQLDAIAEFLRRAQIFRRDRGDAFDIDRALRHLGAEGEAGQDRQLLRGVVAVDVERRIGFGIAEALRVLQAFGERQAFLLHPGQDVIAGAVENAVDAVDRGAGKTFAQGLDDGNGRADRGFEIQRAAVLFGECASRKPCLAISALLAVTTDLPDFSAASIADSAGSPEPPINSTKQSMPGSLASASGFFGPRDAAQIDAALLGLRARGDGDDAHAAAAARRQRRGFALR